MADIGFEGRVAVVTGAGGGLGRSHAMMLAARGAKVVINDLGTAPDGDGSTHSMADKVVEEIKAAGGEATANYDTVSTWEGGEAIIQTALDAYGKLDIVINNAGILRDRSIAKMTDEEWRGVVETHLSGSFYVTRAAFKPLRENNYGRILFTSSGAGLWGNFGQMNYTAAKLGIVGLMHVTKIEGQKYNITANTVAPIAASRLLGSVMTEQMMEALDPGYVSVLACYLLSEECTFTGGVFSAGAGHYGRAAMVEGPGIALGEQEEKVTVETIRDRFSEITDLGGAQEFFKSRDRLVEMVGPDLFSQG